MRAFFDHEQLVDYVLLTEETLSSSDSCLIFLPIIAAFPNLS